MNHISLVYGKRDCIIFGQDVEIPARVCLTHTSYDGVRMNSKLTQNQFLSRLNHLPGPKKSVGTFGVQIEPVVSCNLTSES